MHLSEFAMQRRDYASHARSDLERSDESGERGIFGEVASTPAPAHPQRACAPWLALR